MQIESASATKPTPTFDILDPDAEILTLDDVAVELGRASGRDKPLARSAVTKTTTEGTFGCRLWSVIVGGRRVTTKDALRHFIGQCTANADAGRTKSEAAVTEPEAAHPHEDREARELGLIDDDDGGAA